MAKEAIEAVKAAEEKAKALLQEANQAAKDSKREAEVLAEKKFREILGEAEAKAKELKEKALLEGEAAAKPVIQKGKEETRKFYSLTDEDLEPAVNIIIERIVSANGDS